MNTYTLLNKISSNTEVIGIIGLGYVGLPLAINFAQAGIKVLGFDKSQDKVDRINRGVNYIKDIRDASAPLHISGLLRTLCNIKY